MAVFSFCWMCTAYTNIGVLILGSDVAALGPDLRITVPQRPARLLNTNTQHCTCRWTVPTCLPMAPALTLLHAGMGTGWPSRPYSS